MKSSYHGKKETIIRSIAELFAIGCLIYSFWIKDSYQFFACVAYSVLVLVPFLAEKWFKCKLNILFLLCCIIYSLGSLMGDVFHLYNITLWWDKLLHFTGGIVFAAFGAFLPELFDQKKPSVLLCAVFALCFSLAVSVCWEFCEYGMDQLAGMDAQHSTIVHGIHSYHLGNKFGDIGSIDDIHEVIVNGKPLPFDGYLDIGLNDTMTDMLWEGFGALLYMEFFLMDQRNHPFIRKRKR